VDWRSGLIVGTGAHQINHRTRIHPANVTAGAGDPARAAQAHDRGHGDPAIGPGSSPCGPGASRRDGVPAEVPGPGRAEYPSRRHETHQPLHPRWNQEPIGRLMFNLGLGVVVFLASWLGGQLGAGLISLAIRLPSARSSGCLPVAARPSGPDHRPRRAARADRPARDGGGRAGRAHDLDRGLAGSDRPPRERAPVSGGPAQSGGPARSGGPVSRGPRGRHGRPRPPGPRRCPRHWLWPRPG
jgi:hypothetical protein